MKFVLFIDNSWINMLQAMTCEAIMRQFYLLYTMSFQHGDKAVK